ncbi:MAG: 5-formyltetrahydrofolate cyclo-ligase [Nitrososphaerota archaeon]
MSDEKQMIREEIWRLLESRGVARFPKPIHGRIPNFAGAERAAERILGLEEYRAASVVKVSPDSPQKHVRYRCLLDGKILVMPTPRLREGFLILDPSRIPREMLEQASTIRGALILGRRTHPRDLPRIDFIVTGSVAATRDGLRLGKGGGYSELEYAILLEYGKIDRDIMIATNIHDLQLVDRLPRDPYDLTLDIIATPTKLIRVSTRKERPTGIIWELLNGRKIDEISILKELAATSRNKSDNALNRRRRH